MDTLEIYCRDLHRLDLSWYDSDSGYKERLSLLHRWIETFSQVLLKVNMEIK